MASPYLIAKPTVQYVDLRPLQDRNPILFLFSDGVDNLISDKFVFHQAVPCEEEPSGMVGAFLGDKIEPRVGCILSHKVESRWVRR